jgi:Skp family chaperone for outer membrane proteins
MKKLLLAVAGLIAFSAQAMTQDAPQTQQMLKGKPGLNLMGEKQVDPRMEEYRKAVDQEYNAALKKIPEKKKTNNDPWAGVRSGEPTKK